MITTDLFSRISVPLVLLAASVFSSPALSAAPVKEAKHDLTLAFTISTQEVLGPGRCAPYPTGSTSGTGTAPKLGKFTLSASDCVIPQNPNGPSALIWFQNGELVLEAANKDTSIGTYSGTLDFLYAVPAIGTTPAKLVYTIQRGTIQFTGGTGRFAGLTGHGTLTGTLDIASGKGEFTVNATLTP